MPPDDQRNRRASDAAIEELQREVRAMHGRLDSGARRMNAMQTELTANTQVTQEVRDILDTVRSGLRVLGGLGTIAVWVGKIAAAAAGVAALWHLITTGGKPPGK